MSASVLSLTVYFFSRFIVLLLIKSNSLSFEMCLRRMESSWTVRVKNEEVLYRVKEERIILLAVETGRLTGLVTSCVRITF